LRTLSDKKKKTILVETVFGCQKSTRVSCVLESLGCFESEKEDEEVEETRRQEVARTMTYSNFSTGPASVSERARKFFAVLEFDDTCNEFSK